MGVYLTRKDFCVICILTIYKLTRPNSSKSALKKFYTRSGLYNEKCCPTEYQPVAVANESQWQQNIAQKMKLISECNLYNIVVWEIYLPESGKLWNEADIKIIFLYRTSLFGQFNHQNSARFTQVIDHCYEEFIILFYLGTNHHKI